MEAGKVNEFLDNLEIQDEMVRYQGKLYYFYGIRRATNGQGVYTRIDMFGKDINEFEREVCYIEAPTISECMNLLLTGAWFDGHTFWRAETQMTWVDG